MPSKKLKWNLPVDQIKNKIIEHIRANLDNSNGIININTIKKNLKNEKSDNIKYYGKKMNIYEIMNILFGTIENWVDLHNGYVLFFTKISSFIKYYEKEDIINDWEIINIPSVKIL